MSVLGARRDSSSVKPGLELLVQHSTSSGLAGGAEHKVGEEMLDKTNVGTNPTSCASLALLSDVQPLHNAGLGQLRSLSSSLNFSA